VVQSSSEPVKPVEFVEPLPASSTFASRRAERLAREAAGNGQPARRKLGLGPGESDFEMRDAGQTDRVSQNAPGPTYTYREVSE
jgi:hypothetical protein